MKELSAKQTELLSAFAEAYPNQDTITRQEMFTFAEETGMNRNSVRGLIRNLPTVDRGVYSMVANVSVIPTAAPEPVIQQTPVAEAVQ